jgi:hypothetical protein
MHDSGKSYAFDVFSGRNPRLAYGRVIVVRTMTVVK